MADDSQNDDNGSEESSGGGRQGVVDYLQSPRRKRKSYVITCFGPQIRADLPAVVESFVRQKFDQLAYSRLRGAAEFRRLAGRQVNLLIYDDEFADMDEGLELIATLKEKKHQSVMPVLFLTRNPEALIKGYHKHLMAYHESDDYIDYSALPDSHILAKIQAGLTVQNRRRSRRYRVEAPVEFFHLTSNRMVSGHLVDLSVHGARLVANEEGFIFRDLDQMRLHVPTSRYMPPIEGDFLKLSCRVRRVEIAGNEVGLSFEHLSEKQLHTLTEFLNAIVDAQVTSQSLGRARQSRY